MGDRQCSASTERGDASTRNNVADASTDADHHRADINFAAVGPPPQFDVIEALPPAAADKLRALRQRSVDAHVIIPTFEDVRQASLDRIEAENRLRQLTAHPHEGGFNLHPDNAGVLAQQKLVDKLTADLKRLQELQADADGGSGKLHPAHRRTSRRGCVTASRTAPCWSRSRPR